MAAIEEIDMKAAATLIVAWRTGRNAHGRMVKAGGQVIEALRSHAQDSLEKIATGQGRPYNPDDDQEDAPFLSADQDELLDTALLEQLQIGSSLRPIAPDELRRRSITLYALIIGDDPNNTMMFIRRGNPVSLASKSIVAVFDQTLSRVTEPILAFDPNIDVIIHGSAVWVLNQKNFEALFKESDAVLAKTAEWVDKLDQALPVEPESKEWLSRRLRENSVLRRKIQSILRSQYLSTLTPSILRKQMVARGLDPSKLMKEESLIFNKDTERDILLFLNEDLWTGDFSGEQYAAAAKKART